MHIKGVQEVEKFCREKDLYDDFVAHKLLLRKFNIKSNFVLNKQLQNEVAFRNTFPESKGVWREMSYSRNERIKFWLAEHGFFSIVKVFSK